MEMAGGETANGALLQFLGAPAGKQPSVEPATVLCWPRPNLT